jgi:hypothetical protein
MRFFGLVHAVLMLVLGGYLLSIGLPFLLDPHGMADNAAAGAIALANLVVAVSGAIIFASGVSVMCSVFLGKWTLSEQ